MKNIIEVMTNQHEQLRTDLALALTQFEKGKNFNAKEVLNNINKFKKDLAGHVKL